MNFSAFDQALMAQGFGMKKLAGMKIPYPVKGDKRKKQKTKPKKARKKK